MPPICRHRSRRGEVCTKRIGHAGSHGNRHTTWGRDENPELSGLERLLERKASHRRRKLQYADDARRAGELVRAAAAYAEASRLNAEIAGLQTRVDGLYREDN